jgi:catechol 2,3-dioxygenase-like lactoylglutathione lyase family enzyme
MKTRIHISVPVSNLEASKRFYTALFGTDPSKVKPDYANWRLDQPALHLALVQAPQAAKGHNAVRHFGVELFADADLKGWRERVANAGLTLRDEEEVVCCYAKADKFWAQDPDGNEWEFWVRHEEADAMKGESSAREGECCAPSATVEAASPCCTPAQKAEAQAAQQGCC